MTAFMKPFGRLLATSKSTLPDRRHNASETITPQPMKKRFIILGGLVAASAIYQATPQAAEERKANEIKIEQAKAAAAAREAAREAQFVISADQRTRCRQLIQRAMHNPSSFRWEGSMSDMRRTGVLVYSGTNAFGGRVRETYKCA